MNYAWGRLSGSFVSKLIHLQFQSPPYWHGDLESLVQVEILNNL